MPKAERTGSPPIQKWWGNESDKPTTDNKVVLSLRAYQKIVAYAKSTPAEISGWGKLVETVHKGVTTAYVSDVMIFKQFVSGVHTRLTKEELTDWYLSMVQKGEDPSQWRLWWHSHHNGPVFFSGQDHTTIDYFVKTKLYSLCVNSKGDMKLRLDDKGIYIGDIVPAVEGIDDEEILTACKADIKKLVTVGDDFSQDIDIADYSGNLSKFDRTSVVDDVPICNKSKYKIPTISSPTVHSKPVIVTLPKISRMPRRFPDDDREIIKAEKEGRPYTI